MGLKTTPRTDAEQQIERLRERKKNEAVFSK
jgi:hypothetical protein